MEKKRPVKGVVYKYKRKRLIRLILRLLFVIGLGGILFYVFQASHCSNQTINNVQVVATFEHVNKQALQNVIAPYTKNGFFNLNTFALKHQLLQIPWVYAVAIERQWPDTLLVKLVEQHPIAQWGSEALINAEGIFFSPPLETFPQGLPMIYGKPDQHLFVFKTFQTLQELLAPLKLEIKQLNLAPQHYWHLLFANGSELYASDRDFITQIKNFIKLYPQIMQGHQTVPKTIDLRYKNGLAVNWGVENSGNNNPLLVAATPKDSAVVKNKDLVH
jgi:cell division protein FtsQ